MKPQSKQEVNRITQSMAQQNPFLDLYLENRRKHIQLTASAFGQMHKRYCKESNNTNRTP